MRKLLLPLMIVLAGFDFAGAQATTANAGDAGSPQLAPYYFGRFRVDAQFGWAYRLGKNLGRSTEQKEFINKLRSGYQIGANVAYHIKPNWGFGVHYQFVHSSASEGAIHEKINTVFWGPSFVIRTKAFGANSQWAFFSTVSAGYLGYNDRLTFGNQVEEINEATFGTYVDGGFELQLAKKFYLIGGGSILQGTILLDKQYSSFDEVIENQMSASNIGLYVGLRIGL